MEISREQIFSAGPYLLGGELTILSDGMTDSEFSAIFQAHKNAIYQFAWRMTGSKSIAEDVAQEVFLTVLRDESEVDPARGTLRALLFGITRHLVWQRWRADQRWRSLDDEMPLAAASFNFEQMDVGEAVAQAIGALPPLQREALILATYEGFSLQEIADAVAVETGTVKARLHRARENLKRSLAPSRREHTRIKT